MAATLPPELWLVTLNSQTWSRSDLRALRLTNRTICQAATPLLFKSLLLRPNIDSLKRAQRVSEAPHLAHHVQKLYLRGDVVINGIKTAEDFIDTVRWWTPPMYDTKALCMSAQQYIERYPAMVERQEAYKRVNSFRAISAICKNLPNLFDLDFASMDKDPNSEFSKMYGFEGSNTTSFNVPDQLRLCQVVKPTSVLTPLVEWVYFSPVTMFDQRIDRKLFSGLQSVKHLDIRFEYLEATRDYDDRHISAFQNFWAQTPNVEHLAVGFISHHQSNNSIYPKLVSELLRTKWPWLRKLELVNLDCEQPELHGFLQKHRKTLDDLQLKSIAFTDPLKESLPLMATGFVMRTFIFLHDNLHLRTFAVQGYLRSRDREFFRPRYSDHRDSLLCKLKDFVCHKAAFPFPLAAQILGLTDACIDVDAFATDPVCTIPEGEDKEMRRRLDYERCMDAIYSDSSWEWRDERDELTDFDSDTESNTETDSEMGYISDAAVTDWGLSEEESDVSEDWSVVDHESSNEEEEDAENLEVS